MRGLSGIVATAEQKVAQSEGQLNILSLELQHISAKAARAARLAPTEHASDVIAGHARGLRRAAPVQRPVIQYRLMAAFKLLGDAYQDAMHDRVLEICPTPAQAGLATMVLLRLIRHVGLSGDHTSSLSEVTMDALATQCKITAPQLSKSLRYLEAAGAISRQRIGRKAAIHLTPEGVYRGTRTAHAGAVLRFHQLVNGIDDDSDVAEAWDPDADGDDICASDAPAAQPVRQPFIPHVVDRRTEEVNRRLRNVLPSMQDAEEDRIRRSMARGHNRRSD
jgi:DNA-binding transcriptional ArsR family regulator